MPCKLYTCHLRSIFSLQNIPISLPLYPAAKLKQNFKRLSLLELRVFLDAHYPAQN